MFNYKLDFMHVLQKTTKFCVTPIRHRRVENTDGVVFDLASSVAFRAATYPADVSRMCTVRINLLIACVFTT